MQLLHTVNGCLIVSSVDLNFYCDAKCMTSQQLLSFSRGGNEKEG